MLSAGAPFSVQAAYGGAASVASAATVTCRELGAAAAGRSRARCAQKRVPAAQIRADQVRCDVRKGPLSNLSEVWPHVKHQKNDWCFVLLHFFCWLNREREGHPKNTKPKPEDKNQIRQWNDVRTWALLKGTEQRSQAVGTRLCNMPLDKSRELGPNCAKRWAAAESRPF